MRIGLVFCVLFSRLQSPFRIQPAKGPDGHPPHLGRCVLETLQHNRNKRHVAGISNRYKHVTQKPVASDPFHRRGGEDLPEFGIIQRRQLGQQRPFQLGPRMEGRLLGDGRELVPRADRQTVVATIDTIAHGLPEFLRDRWVPEMKSQLREAQKGEAAALKRVAKGCAAQRIPVDSVSFEDGVSASEAAFLTRGLNRFRDAQRKAWRQRKSQRDDALIAQGWDAPEASKAIQNAEFNQVLLDWTTGADVLSAGIAVEDDDLLNSVDALYAPADWPGLGTFYSAHSWMGTTVSKRTANWTVLPCAKKYLRILNNDAGWRDCCTPLSARN